MSLPELIAFTDDWNSYLDSIYAIYVNEIVHAGLRFRKWPVKCRFHPPTQGKGYGFWHCIQEGRVEEDRLPDFRRCERLRWIPWIIEQAETDPRISVWKEKRGADIDIVLWIEEEMYVVVLSERRDYYLLKTAYCADKPHKRESLRKNRERFAEDKND